MRGDLAVCNSALLVHSCVVRQAGALLMVLPSTAGSPCCGGKTQQGRPLSPWPTRIRVLTSAQGQVAKAKGKTWPRSPPIWRRSRRLPPEKNWGRSPPACLAMSCQRLDQNLPQRSGYRNPGNPIVTYGEIRLACDDAKRPDLRDRGRTEPAKAARERWCPCSHSRETRFPLRYRCCPKTRWLVPSRPEFPGR
jgi:hypothetical protein